MMLVLKAVDHRSTKAAHLVLIGQLAITVDPNGQDDEMAAAMAFQLPAYSVLNATVCLDVPERQDLATIRVIHDGASSQVDDDARSALVRSSLRSKLATILVHGCLMNCVALGLMRILQMGDELKPMIAAAVLDLDVVDATMND